MSAKKSRAGCQNRQCDRIGTWHGRTYERRKRGAMRGRTLVWWDVEARAGSLEDRLLFEVSLMSESWQGCAPWRVLGAKQSGGDEEG